MSMLLAKLFHKIVFEQDKTYLCIIIFTLFNDNSSTAYVM